ncbi:hypothetical protein TNCV_411311 [Trichonephila clavipes]|nr:hypothetical protein TNCV_411311 [Trichonephila clavipes]
MIGNGKRPYLKPSRLKRHLKPSRSSPCHLKRPMKQRSPKIVLTRGSNDMLDRSNEIFGERATTFQSRSLFTGNLMHLGEPPHSNLGDDSQ